VAVLLASLTFVSTMLGGLFALRNRDRLHRILGFTAGVILGVVVFDVLPEIADLSQSTGVAFTVPMIALAIGFLAFQGLEKTLLVHHTHEQEYGHHVHVPAVGVASASALIGHSLTDGVAIGLAVQVNASVGVAVALAVIGHDFADGLNTVSLMLVQGADRRRAAVMLILDALAPLAGAALTLLFTVPDSGLLIYLGAFAGFLLYIGASDILPEAHAGHPSLVTYGLTVLGTAFMFVVLAVIG
jgi:ZIP family zinc transporter